MTPEPSVSAADTLRYLMSAPLFARAGEPVLARLAAASTIRRVARHETIYRPGRRADTVYLVRAGQVRLLRVDAEGEEATLAVVGPLDVFGERAVAGDEVRDEAAEAMVASLICDIPRGELEAALEASPSLVSSLSRLFARRTRQLERRLADLVFKGAEARLCTVLLQLAADYGRPAGPDAVDIQLTLTARDLGHLAGVGRQTASTLLSSLRRQGLVAGGPWQLRLARLEEVRRRASADGVARTPGAGGEATPEVPYHR